MGLSLRRNIIANYVGQAYVTIIGIALVPLYLGYMGAEAYGLVGFFTMMNAWFALLDIGLTPTLSREVARFRGGALDARTLRGLLRMLKLIFGGVGIAAAASFVLASATIAHDWLKVDSLPLGDVRHSVALMGLIIPLRWMSGLYRGVVNGFESQVRLAGLNIAIATARFVGVLAVFHLIGTSPVQFFTYQFAVGALEFLSLATMAHRLLPAGSTAPGLREGWAALRGVLGFSLTVAFTGSVWVLITQTDKLVLSRMLSLTEYGYFSLAAVVSGGVTIIGAPIAQAVLPRLARLSAEGLHSEALELYRRATQLVCLMAVPASAMLSAFAGPVLVAWTGDATASAAAAPVLQLYAAGNGVLTLAALAYYLQYAMGDLRLHLMGNALMLVVYVPALYWCASLWGGVGAGTAWVAAIGSYFLLWVPLVHRRLAPGLHVKWMTRDVLPIVIVAVLTTILIKALITMPADRIVRIVAIIGLGLVVMASSLAASPVARDLLVTRFKRRTSCA